MEFTAPCAGRVGGPALHMTAMSHSPETATTPMSLPEPVQREAKDLQPGDTFIHVHHEEQHLLVAVEHATLVDSPVGTKWARVMASTGGREGYVEYGADHLITLIDPKEAGL